jgi:hypothetical protein
VTTGGSFWNSKGEVLKLDDPVAGRPVAQPDDGVERNLVMEERSRVLLPTAAAYASAYLEWFFRVRGRSEHGQRGRVEIVTRASGSVPDPGRRRADGTVVKV